ncbi:MAG: adenylate kinase [Ignavibacteria bacterium]|nr:MAG: adenylate kinase [Ignavibacteria bacterium]
MNIIIFGAPGVGKGTQAKILASKFNIAHISTGDILREAIANQTEIGIKAKEIVDRGELVPDNIMGEIIKDALKSDKCKNGFILDGFPRTLNQAEVLLSIFDELGISDVKLIKLTVKDDVIIKRLTSRRTCSNCGFIANLLNMTDVNKCPNCGMEGTLQRRSDDSEEIIKNRLEIYMNSTKPVFDFLQKKIKMVSIDGSQPVEKVTEEILANLN